MCLDTWLLAHICVLGFEGGEEESSPDLKQSENS
jgi:hypothetical protein